MRRIFAMLFVAMLLLVTGGVAYAEEEAIPAEDGEMVVELSILTPPERTEYAAFDTLDKIFGKNNKDKGDQK